MPRKGYSKLDTKGHIIRQMLDLQISKTVICARFGVSAPCLRKFLTKKGWN